MVLFVINAEVNATLCGREETRNKGKGRRSRMVNFFKVVLTSLLPAFHPMFETALILEGDKLDSRGVAISDRDSKTISNAFARTEKEK